MSCLYLSRRIHAEGFTPQPIEPVSDQDKVAFLKACKAGNLEAAKAYCEQHPGSVNVQDGHGKSGLMLAAGSGAFKVVEYLSTVPGYVVGMEDENWENALFDAARANSAKIVALLIRKKLPLVVNKNCLQVNEILTTQTPNKVMLKQLGDLQVAQAKFVTVIITDVLHRIQKDPSGREKYIAETEEILGRKLIFQKMGIPTLPQDIDLKEFKKKQKEVMKDVKKSVLEDPAIQIKIVDFFRAHPQVSIEAARDTVINRYRIKPTVDSLEQLLKWGKIEFKKAGKMNGASEVD